MKFEELLKQWMLFWFSELVKADKEAREMLFKWGRENITEPCDLERSLLVAGGALQEQYVNQVLWLCITKLNDYLSSSLHATEVCVLFKEGHSSFSVIKDSIPPDIRKKAIESIIRSIELDRKCHADWTLEEMVALSIDGPVGNYINDRQHQRPQVAEVIKKVAQQFR
ncbi:MAG: hypothetical protein WCT08_04660 [Patescibacteria group bacterium]